MSIFAQVWLWSLLAFALGALLTWVLLARPAQARVRELERKLVADRSEVAPAQQERAGLDFDHHDDMAADYAYVGAPEQLRSDHHDDGAFDYFDGADTVDGADRVNNTEHVAPQRWADEPEQEPATGVYEPARAEQTEYLPHSQALDGDMTSVFDPAPVEPYEPAPAEPEPGRGLFQPATPTTGGPAYEQQEEPVVDDEPVFDDEPATEALPKRRPKESPRGGFDPPQPVQPSMRTVTRREPVPEEAGSSGSLFEPSAPSGDPACGQDLAAETAAEPAEASAGTTVGPFGPGSAMPLPGGAKPSEQFTVKASVTTLRYCAADSPKFPEMVAEVWFRTPEDAERVGFRPIN